MKKISHKVKNRETRLPLLMQVDLEETGGLVRFTEFNVQDFTKRLERALLKCPEFRPPYTTVGMPACILDLKVYPDLGRGGSFTLYVDLLPGDKTLQYHEENLKRLRAAPKNDNGTSAKRQKA